MNGYQLARALVTAVALFGVIVCLTFALEAVTAMAIASSLTFLFALPVVLTGGAVLGAGVVSWLLDDDEG